MACPGSTPRVSLASWPFPPGPPACPCRQQGGGRRSRPHRPPCARDPGCVCHLSVGSEDPALRGAPVPAPSSFLPGVLWGTPPRGFWGKHPPPTHFNSPVPPVPGYGPAPALLSSFPPLPSAPPTKYDEAPSEGVSCRPQRLAVKQPAMGPSRMCSGLQGLLRCPRLEPEQARPQGPTSKACHQANPHRRPSPFPLHRWEPEAQTPHDTCSDSESQCRAELGVWRDCLTPDCLLSLPGEAEEGLREGASWLQPRRVYHRDVACWGGPSLPAGWPCLWPQRPYTSRSKGSPL